MRRSWTVAKEDPEPKGSIRKVLKQHTKAPRKERTVKLRLVEREVQASRVTAKGQYMVQNKHRAWIAPKARPQPKASESRVKKEFVEIQPQRGVTMVSLTGSEASDVGDMEEIPRALPESAPTPSEGPKSCMSSGLTGQERITSETIVRIGTTPEGEVVAKRQEIKPGTAYFMKRQPQEKEKVKFHVPGQVTVEASWQRRSERDRCQYFQMDVGDSRSTGSTPGVAGSGGRQTGGDGESGRHQAEGTGKSGKRRSGEDVGSDRPDGNSGAENSTDSGPKNATDTNDETQSEKSTAHRRAKSGGGRGVSSKSQRPSQGSRRGYRDPQGRESVHGIRIRCKESTEVPGTSDRRGVRTAVSLRASIRATGRSDRMGEGKLARQAKEEEERRKAKALYRSERMAQALEHGKEVQRRRQEEFEKGKQDLLQWRAEEEDRENLRKARRISLEQPAVPPASGGVGGVTLTPAPTAAMGENPSTPPEALQAPLSEEEIAYRKQLQEHLSKFSDKREDAK